MRHAKPMKTVLITGASTGIGWDSVRALVEKEYRVVATVRNQDDASRLKQSFHDQVIPIILDLMQLERIAELPQILKQTYKIERLDGLVNNAGIAQAGPFLDQDFSEIENTIRLNVLAVMKMTQVLLPMLGATAQANHAGTIVNISSIAGTGGSPFLAAYAASKHALEGFSDALRKELMIFGIKVVVIGPGSIKTPIWDKGFKVIQYRYEKSIYAKPFARFISIALNQSKNALEVSAVSNLVLKSFEDSSPAFRYAPIPRPITNWYIPNILPKKLYNYLTAKALGLNKS